MGWINVFVCFISAYLWYSVGNILLLIISSINAMIQLWSFGMKYKLAKSSDRAIPDKLSGLNLLTFVIGIILIIIFVLSSFF